MSGITLYDVSFGEMEKIATTLIGILKTATQSPDAESFPTAKLYEDMKPLSYQVHIVEHTVVRAIREITGSSIEFPVEGTNPPTMADLIASAEKTLALVKGVDAASVNGKEDSPVVVVAANAGTWNMTGKSFILNFAIPNLFFHLQTTYAILRNNGVPLGKKDFLGPFAGPPSSAP
jgi:hypothetical protein